MSGTISARTVTVEILTDWSMGAGVQTAARLATAGEWDCSNFMFVDDPVRAKIQCRANASEIRETALQRGMKLLRENGVAKVLRGATAVEEVSRVTVRSAM
jgi:type II secretory ATPase GspE/PulE/Tfp pilus assembly ATPase PilB-like protein